jgi:hypothetical protein
LSKDEFQEQSQIDYLRYPYPFADDEAGEPYINPTAQTEFNQQMISTSE